MFDYYSQFWGVPFYHSDNFHLIDCSPKEIKFSDDSIYVDEYKFYKNYTVLIDNNLPWRTNIVLSEQAPGNLKLVNKNPNSVITIESLNSNLTNSLVIEPGCPIAFSNVVGEISIKFKITSPSQFIIPEKFNVKFKSIEILNELDILTGNEIEVDDLKVSNTEIVPSGSISTQSVLFDSQNYNEVGCFKANVVNTTEDSFFRADLMGTDDVHIYIPIKSTSIPYMQFTSNNQKGHIYFVIDDNDNYIPHNLTEEFKILVLNIENSSCKNWKIHVSQAIKYITARCDNDYPDMYIFIERVQPAKIWITIVIALCSVIVFISLVFASLYIYAKLKRKMELNYLNRLYEEKSFEAINQSLLPEAEEY
ncbi:hypothetical protein TVAG_196680 [Trichomonas vaginalis G3]|uniref:Uncharacterized protein n=1 Tax=Trichomonas vaginalis (strain ATCC PRA-98 / G3) TaxID=412133 RepID=A2FCY7_TRIV3|nr:hypothetical protein TVAGG3_0705330 [Trichomonas vaginalis G3]EAX97225.1 hypothetical protein TVAG_196680 [Trichomonas vaginalis G3]KAI5509532.1 hypothetical protein TVAGG3_0705330 [Trichomonas vaginalis G3]|eukprot:XP_001310155.1 hypothetical protein [Trichomonas vaginalis G3]